MYIFFDIYTCHIRKAAVFVTKCGFLVARVCMISSHCVFAGILEGPHFEGGGMS